MTALQLTVFPSVSRTGISRKDGASTPKAAIRLVHTALRERDVSQFTSAQILILLVKTYVK